MYPYKILSILSINKKNCIAVSMAGHAKKGNRDETRRERERKEYVSKMGCIHTHFYTEIKGENIAYCRHLSIQNLNSL